MRVLLVSSYKVSCGVAAYTESLESLLARDFDVTVFPLDPSILKSKVPHVVEAGDRLIRDLCAQLDAYDVVNLQWEPGLLGDRYDLMSKRLGWILEAADRLILTVHTVVPYPEERRLLDFLSYVRRKGILRAPLYFLNSDDRYRKDTYRILHERAKSSKGTYVAVHTERERQFFRNVVGFENVFDHPLSLIRADWPERLRQDTPRARRDLEELFPGKHTFIGIYGFLSEYKGILTALKAMKLLDSGHQLLIYGGVHPGVLQEGEPVNDYVKELMDEIEADALRAKAQAFGPTEGADAAGAEGARTASGTGSDAPASKVVSLGWSNAKPGNTLLDKVAFLGAPDDYEFALAMSAVDICVFPYLEVGQSGSGPVSQAVELGKPTIVSRTKAFIEFAKYHPDNFETIDIGNHIQLAQAIRRLSKLPPRKAPVRYNGDTLAAFYGRLIRGLGNRMAEAAE